MLVQLTDARLQEPLDMLKAKRLPSIMPGLRTFAGCFVQINRHGDEGWIVDRAMDAKAELGADLPHRVVVGQDQASDMTNLLHPRDL